MNTSPLQVSICIPAYNEGKNIGLILQALVNQKTEKVEIKKIVVVSSGSTDETEEITESFIAKDNRVFLIRQESRNGKASAINAFLKIANEQVVVIESADTIPRPDTIEILCQPFITNPEIGMTGGAPIPVNDPNTCIGYIVHTWWWFHRHIPRFGEIIAYRNILEEISEKTAVDEAFIQAKIIQQGMKAVHIDEAVVQNKGPETISDLLKQRRRIFNGHSRLYHEQGIKIDNMTKSSLSLLWEYKNPTLKHQIWFMTGIGIEVLARILGTYDAKVKKINPFVWDTATSTKHLSKHKKWSGVFQPRPLAELDDISGSILFINFAPLTFGGGVERWISTVAESIAPSQEVNILQVDKSISDIYAKLVLKRSFDARIPLLEQENLTHTLVTWKSFIPFTEKWKSTRQKIKSAQFIYTKLEVNETFLILYFGGFPAIKRTIVGLHSPFYYNHSTLTFFENLHNTVYSSFLVKFFLSNVHKVHVLNPDQQQKLIKDFGLSNVKLIPNFIDKKVKANFITEKNRLKICFIGELSNRKGADILLKLIHQSPNYFSFDIIGDGHLKESFLQLSLPNVKYHGYLDREKVDQIISKSDVLFMPSRAESFSLASLEALAHGLVVVCSSDISPNTLEKYLVINKSKTVKGYLKILEDIYVEKTQGKLTARRHETATEIGREFSKTKLLGRLQTELFNLKLSI